MGSCYIIFTFPSKRRHIFIHDTMVPNDGMVSWSNDDVLKLVTNIGSYSPTSMLCRLIHKIMEDMTSTIYHSRLVGAGFVR